MVAPTTTVIRPVLPPPPDGAFGSIPRMGIIHAEAKFSLNDFEVSPERLKHVIMLGLVRQRTYWEHEGSILRCKSFDFEHGNPTDEFPWDESNFSVPEGEPKPKTLPCGSCAFKDFVADPTARRGWKAAPCIEQFVVPVLVPTDEAAVDGGIGSFLQYTLATVMFQKSSMKPIKEYLTDFKKANQPSYFKTTRLGLKVNLGSGFKYSVPTLTTSGDVDSRAYPALSALLAACRGTLSTPPPKQEKTGGMLSVSDKAEPSTGYSGSFFR